MVGGVPARRQALARQSNAPAGQRMSRRKRPGACHHSSWWACSSWRKCGRYRRLMVRSGARWLRRTRTEGRGEGPELHRHGEAVELLLHELANCMPAVRGWAAAVPCFQRRDAKRQLVQWHGGGTRMLSAGAARRVAHAHPLGHRRHGRRGPPKRLLAGGRRRCPGHERTHAAAPLHRRAGQVAHGVFPGPADRARPGAAARRSLYAEAIASEVVYDNGAKLRALLHERLGRGVQELRGDLW